MDDRESNIPGVGSWKTRRRIMYANLAFSMGVIIWVLWKDMTSTVAETAITMAFFSIISTVGTYVFGAAWQDISTVKVHGARPKRGGYRTESYSGLYATSRVDNPDEE